MNKIRYGTGTLLALLFLLTGTVTQESTAQPYACISGSPSVAENSGSTLDFTVGFYSDVACTVPVNPGAGYNFNIDVVNVDTSPTDYSPSSSSWSTLAPGGSLPTTFSVTPAGDTIYEIDEELLVTLSGVTGAGASLGTSTSATGTITNDDLPPALSVAPATVTEGGRLEFVVSIPGGSSEVNLTFSYDTVDGGAEADPGAATSTGRVDFTAVVGGSGGISASSGVTSTAVNVFTTDDVLWERVDETMTLDVTAVTHSTGTPSATGTIQDNEATPTLTASSPTVDEGDVPGDAVTLDFVVTISPRSDFDTTINWETDDGTAKSFAESGVADPDYIDVDWTTLGAVSIPADTDSDAISVEVFEDEFFEEDGGSRLETMTLDLLEGTISTNSGGLDAGTIVDGTGTIRDDDPLTDFADGPESYKVAGHYITSATYLGALVDPDLEPLNSPDARLDDTTDLADEDGVLAAATFIPGGTTVVDVEIGDAGYLNIWFDWDNSGYFENPTERVVSEFVPAYTTQRYFIEVPETAVIPGTELTYSRYRICSIEAECNIPEHPTEIATDGEAEDHEITISNDLVITGTSEETETTFFLTFDGDDYVVTDSEGVEVLRAPKSGVESLTFNSDHLVVDFTNGSPIPTDGITFNGNYFNSSLTLSQSNDVATINDIDYTYENDHDGTIAFDGDILTFKGLTPIFESLVAGNKTFTYPDVTEPSLIALLTQQPEGKVIRLTPDGDTGGAGNGKSFIDCVLCGEETHFLNPTATLTINAGTGSDSLYIGRLDDVVPASFTTLNINGGGAAVAPAGPTVLAHDYINVTPSAAYEINVDGGDPATTDANACISPDVLDLSVNGGTLTYTDFDAGEGTWTFPGFADVNFTDIEMQADQPYSVALRVSPSLAYATDLTDIEVEVVNNGVHPIRCLQVDLPRALLAIGDGEPDNDNTPYANQLAIGVGEDNGDYRLPDSFVDVDQFGAETALTFTTFYDQDLYPTNRAVEGAFLGVLEMGITELDPGHTLRATWEDILIANYLLMPETYDVRARLQTVETGNENIMGLRYLAGQILAEDDVTFDKGFYFPAKTHVNTAIFVEKAVTAFGGVSATYEQLIVGVFQGAPGITGSVWCRVPLTIETGTVLWDPPAGTLGGEESLHWRPCSGADIEDDPSTPAVDESRIALPYPLHPNKLFLDDNATPALDDDILWLTTWGSAGLYKSEDFGQTWMAAWPGIGPGNASIGAYWTNVYTIAKNASNDFLYISANDGMLFHSLNRGQSWQQIGSLPNVDADTPWSLISHPTEDRVLYAGTFGRGVYFSNDYGFTWAPLTSEANIGESDNENVDLYTDHQAGHIFDMVMDDDGEYLIVGTGNGVWRVDIDPDGSTLGGAGLTADDGVIADGAEWEFLGHDVELEDGSIVTPEIRSLAVQDVLGDGVGSADDILVAGAWGAFLSDNRRTVSAFSLEDPFGVVSAGEPGDNNDSFEDLALRGVSVNFITVSPSGEILVGSAAGTLHHVGTVSSSTSTANEVDSAETVIPISYALGQNYPNPFNPVTTIGFDLPATGHVRLAVYDVLGREVALLLAGQVEAGQHQVRFDAHNLPSGSYLYRLDTEQGSFTRQLVLMK